jgi:hypothetical protein
MTCVEKRKIKIAILVLVFILPGQERSTVSNTAYAVVPHRQYVIQPNTVGGNFTLSLKTL